MKRLLKKFEDMMVAITFAEAGELDLDEAKAAKKMQEIQDHEQQNAQPSALRTGA